MIPAPVLTVSAPAPCSPEHLRGATQIPAGNGRATARSLGRADDAMTRRQRMIDVDVATVDPDLFPYPFLQKLEDLGIRTVEVSEQDERRVVKCLAARPGRVIMPRGLSNRTADRVAGSLAAQARVARARRSCPGTSGALRAFRRAEWAFTGRRPWRPPRCTMYAGRLPLTLAPLAHRLWLLIDKQNSLSYIFMIDIVNTCFNLFINDSVLI